MFTRLSVKRIWPMPDQYLSSCPNVVVTVSTTGATVSSKNDEASSYNHGQRLAPVPGRGFAVSDLRPPRGVPGAHLHQVYKRFRN